MLTLGQKVLPPHVRVHRNPLLLISFLVSGFGMQSMMMGLLAELLMRTYHESQGKSVYVVRDVIRSRQPGIGEDKVLVPSNLN